MKIFLLLLLVFTASISSFAQVTPNLGLNLPVHGTVNWDTPLNQNFNLLDSYLTGGLTIPGTLKVTGLNISGGLTVPTLTISGIATGTQCLHANGSGVVTGTGNDCNLSAFGAITSGTNANALLIGTGGSLNATGSGTINATTLLGSTWVVPGTIGSTTPNTGAFTTLSATNETVTNLTINGTCTGCGGGGGSPAFSVVTSGTNTSALLIGTGGSLGVTSTGTIDSTTLLGKTWAIPGTVGSTTPNTGAFTTLSATGAVNVGGQITSTVSTGTAPLVIASTTNIPNLNASLLLGSTWAIPGTIGATTPSNGTFVDLTVTGVCTGCSGSTTAFASVTAGTNTAALVIGSGGSLGISGSGTVTATSFLGLTAGTSGGVPYFSGASTLASSAALTANLPVIGGGAGTAPSVGTRTGNTTQFASWTGATTASRCVDTDASGNLKIFASDCNVGTVTSVAETFTGGLISVANSPITSSGTLALTVAGVSGGVPYFSSGSTWASSALLTANALIKGGGVATAPLSSLFTDTGTVGAYTGAGGFNSAIGSTTPNAGAFTTISATGLVSIAPATSSANGALNISPATGNTGTPSLILNNPSGTTADILDTEVNGTKQFFVDSAGNATFQASSASSPSFTLLNNDGSGAPSAPPPGGFWCIFPGCFYYDGTATQQMATWNQANQFTRSQTIAATSAANPALSMTAGIGTAGAASSAHAFDINALGGTNEIWVCTDTGASCPTPFTLLAPALGTNGTTNGTETFTSTGVDPRTLYAVPANSFRLEAPNTITTSFRMLGPAAAATNSFQMLTFDACPNDADGVPKCTGTIAGLPKADVFEAGLSCSDAGANDTYACSLSPAITAYVTGTSYRIKANTANTGAASINLNALGAKTIKKAAGGITTDLADNDIRAGQWVDMVYDGTNMEMQSNLGNAPAGSGTVTTSGSPAAHQVAIFSSGSAITGTAVGGSNTVLHGNTAADPTYSAVVEADQTLADNTTNNSSTSNHGYLKKLDNTATHYIDGTGAWSTPAGTAAFSDYQQAASATSTGTDVTVYTTSIPGGTFAAGHGLTIEYCAQKSAGSAVSTYKITYDTTALTVGSGTVNTMTCGRAVIANDVGATNSQQVSNSYFIQGGSTQAATVGTAAVDSTATKNLKLTVTNSTDTTVPKMWKVTAF